MNVTRMAKEKKLSKQQMILQILNYKKQTPGFDPILETLALNKIKIKELEIQINGLMDPQTTKKRPKWDDEMVEHLLKLRTVEFKSIFQRDSSNQQRNIYWENLTIKFNVELIKRKKKEEQKSSIQLQTKYSALPVIINFILD